MAGNNSDGSITIDTELDNDGFEKGSKKLLAAVDNLTGAVDNLGDNMMRSFQQVIPLLQSIANSASSTYQLMASEGQQVADTNDRIASSQRAVASAAKATHDVLGSVQQQAQNAANNLAQAEQNAKSFGANLSEAISSSAFNRDVNDAQKSCDSLTRQIEKISDAAKLGFRTDSQIAKFQMQVDKARENVTQMELKLMELGNQTIKTEDYEYYEKAIKKATDALFNLYNHRELMEKMGVKESSAQWKRLAIQIKYAEEQLARYETSQSGMVSNGTAFVSGDSTSEYAKMAEQVSGASAALSQLEEIAAALVNTNPALSTAAILLGGFGNAMKAAGSAALNLAKKLKSLTFKKIKNDLKLAIDGLKKFVIQSRKTSISSKGLIKSLTSLKTMLISRIKRMFISAVFSQMKEAFNDLTKISKDFDRSMSNMKNSSTEMSANMASAFSNLIMAVEPVITKIIGSISTAMSYLNAFFSMLNGKGTMVVAKKQTASYAASLDKSSKAAKELNRQLMGFDEINRLDKKNDSSSDSESGQDLFEEVPIDSILPAEVSAYFERLKSAIRAGDWEGVGKVIAEGLNTGLSIVDNWINTVLRPLGVKWSERIARILNGLVGGFDWTVFGKTIADGINTITNIVNTFFDVFDFENLGRKIGEGFKSLITNVDWGALGQFLTNKIAALFEVLHGFLETFTPEDAATLGANIAKMFQSAISNINVAQLIPDIVKLFTDLLIVLGNVIATMDWNQIGRDLATGIANIDWGLLATAIFNGIGAVLGGLASFLQGLLSAAWDSVVNWWFEKAYEDGEFTISGLLKGIGDTLVNIGKWIVDHIFKPFIDGFKKAFSINSPSKVMEEMGGFVVTGFLNGLTNNWGSIPSFFSTAITNISSLFTNFNWHTIGSNICTGISNGLNAGWRWLSGTVSKVASGMLRTAENALAIHSPSRLFRDRIGKNVILGWAEGIEGTEGTVLRTVANVAKNITDSAKADVPEIQYSGDSLLTGLDAVAAKLSGVADIFQNITNMLSSVSTLSVPDIATGTVVPYRTKVEDTNALYGANTSPQVGQTDMIRELRQMFDSVIRAIEEKETNISIGDDQFDGIIASSNRKRNLRSGGYA